MSNGTTQYDVKRGMMLGKRLKKAILIAKKRFKNWYPDMDIKNEPNRLGSLRKTNVICSCQMCRNPRHSTFYNQKNKMTIQEQKAFEKFENDLKENQQDSPQEYSKIVDEHFWELG